MEMVSMLMTGKGIYQELEEMKNEICEPIFRSTEQLLNEYFPLDEEAVNDFIGQEFFELWDVPKQDAKYDVKPGEKYTEYEDYLYETKGDVLKFMELTLKRYGYFPMTFVKKLKRQHSILKEEIEAKADWFKNETDAKQLIQYFDNLLQLLDSANKTLDGLEEKGKARESNKYRGFIYIYKAIGEQVKNVRKQEKCFLEKHQGEFLQIGMGNNDYGPEEYDNVDEELQLMNGHILYCIRTLFSRTYFIHRCKNYRNRIRNKEIPEKDFLELCHKKIFEIEEPAKNTPNKNLVMCVNAFSIVEKSGDMIIYPEVLEDILIKFTTEKKWEYKLKKFAGLLGQNKNEEKDYTGKKPYLYRKSIAELEKSIFAENENYSYELCCAWNELGGFTLSAVIEKFLYFKDMHSKAFLKGKCYAEHRERFYKALGRCCKVLVDFSRKESWIQGIELARYVFGTYHNEFKDKKVSPDDTCNSMEALADTLELLGVSLERILKKYEYNGQNIGADGFPRAETSQMWEDDREYFKNAFYNEMSEGYGDGSNENQLYVNILQIVFLCVNGGMQEM